MTWLANRIEAYQTFSTIMVTLERFEKGRLVNHIEQLKPLLALLRLYSSAYVSTIIFDYRLVFLIKQAAGYDEICSGSVASYWYVV